MLLCDISYKNPSFAAFMTLFVQFIIQTRSIRWFCVRFCMIVHTNLRHLPLWGLQLYVFSEHNSPKRPGFFPQTAKRPPQRAIPNRDSNLTTLNFRFRTRDSDLATLNSRSRTRDSDLAALNSRPDPKPRPPGHSNKSPNTSRTLFFFLCLWP